MRSWIDADVWCGWREIGRYGEDHLTTRGQSVSSYVHRKGTEFILETVEGQCRALFEAQRAIITQACLGDTAGLVPNHCNDVNVTIK